jgi:hypothetical protein
MITNCSRLFVGDDRRRRHRLFGVVSFDYTQKIVVIIEADNIRRSLQRSLVGWLCFQGLLINGSKSAMKTNQRRIKTILRGKYT